MARKPPDYIREKIFARDQWTCRYCKTVCVKEATKFPAMLKLATLDHVVPRVKGGGNSQSNLVTACWDCNHRKGNRSVDEAGMTLHPAPPPPRKRKKPVRVKATKTEPVALSFVGSPSWVKAMQTYEKNQQAYLARPQDYSYSFKAPQDILFNPDTDNPTDLSLQVAAYVMQWDLGWQGIVDYGSITGWHLLTTKTAGVPRVRDIAGNLVWSWHCLQTAPLTTEEGKEIRGSLYAQSILDQDPVEASLIICRTLLRKIGERTTCPSSSPKTS